MVGLLSRWWLPGGRRRIRHEQGGSVFPQAPAKGREQGVALMLFLVCICRIIALNQALVHGSRLVVLEGATVVRDSRLLWLLVVDRH